MKRPYPSTDTTTSRDEEPREHVRIGAATRGALLSCAALTVASGTTLAPALPSIRQAFEGTPAVDGLVKLVVTLPALAIALTAPFAGRLGDRAGARRVLLVGLVVYAAAGLSGLLSPGLASLLAGRALLGVAAAAVMTSSTAIAAAILTPAERQAFLARQASVMSLAGVLAVALGGVLATAHWRAPFALYALALPIALAITREVTHAVRRVEVLPVEHPTMGNHDAGRRVRRTAYLVATVAMAFVFMVPLQVPFLLPFAEPKAAGLAVAMTTLCAAASSALIGRRRPRTPGPLRWIARSFFVMGAGYAVVGAVPGAAMLGGLALAGIGSGFVMPFLGSWVVATTSERTRGAGIGFLTASVYAGQFMSPVVSMLLRANRTASFMFTAAGATLLMLGCVLLALGPRLER